MNPPVIKDKKPERPRYVSVKLTPNQVRLLYVEMTTNASCCDDDQLRREYEVIANKFNKGREPR